MQRQVSALRVKNEASMFDGALSAKKLVPIGAPSRHRTQYATGMHQALRASQSIKELTDTKFFLSNVLNKYWV
jgi:hypothetical protein